MDAMESLDDGQWRFLCSGEQLPSGSFQAVVRQRVAPNDQIRTLVLDAEKFDSASRALDRAKKLAMKWARDRSAEDDAHV